MAQNTSYRGGRTQEEFDLGFMRAPAVSLPARKEQGPVPTVTRRSSAARPPRDLDVKELIILVRRNLPAGDGPALSATERVWWANCKETIRVSDRHDVRRALSLFLIHKQRLYRADYPTWAAFAWDIYSLSRSHANRLIVYAEFLKELKLADPFPTERQFRNLNRLPGTADQKQKIWTSAVSLSRGGLVTRALLYKAAEKHLGLSALGPLEPQKESANNGSVGMVHKRFGLPAVLILRAAKAAKNMKLSLGDFVQAAIEAMVARSASAPASASRTGADGPGTEATPGR